MGLGSALHPLNSTVLLVEEMRWASAVTLRSASVVTPRST